MKTKKVKAKVTKYGKQEDAMDVYLDNLFDEHGITYEAIFGKGGAFKMMQKRLLEKMLKGENASSWVRERQEARECGELP